ncbi:PepSY-associated TM helix domain-containing protein [Actinomadura craniellae]|nr:PepSY domain-containing protein [Actinomadura craniellae]
MSVDTAARPSVGPPSPSDQGVRYRAVWRWHFYAGLVVAPVLLVLAITGSVYLFKSPYEEWRYRDLMAVRPAGTAQPLAAQIRAATATHPDRPMVSVIPATKPDRSTKVTLAGKESGPFAPGLSVYVNPYTGKVLGEVDESATLMRKVRTIHGELMAGKVGDRIVEASACWALILVCSGLYLWRRGPARNKLRNRKGNGPGTGADAATGADGATRTGGGTRNGRNGRPLLRRVHALTGASAGIVIVFLILSGLPWSGVWGEGLSNLSARLGSTAPDGEKYARESTPLAGDLTQDPATKVPWAGEKQPVPSSTPGGGHAGHGGHTGGAVGAIPVETALAAARAQATHCPPPECDFIVLLPKGPRGVYTVNVDSRRDPGRQRTLHVDQYSGKVLGSYGWSEYGVLAKGVEQGISLHEGRRYGLPNLLVMLGACLALITLTVTGAWMWWKRRPEGKLGAPARPADKRTSFGLIAIMVVLGVLFPLAGITMIAALLFDTLVLRRIPALNRRFG